MNRSWSGQLVPPTGQTPTARAETGLWSVPQMRRTPAGWTTAVPCFAGCPLIAWIVWIVWM